MSKKKESKLKQAIKASNPFAIKRKVKFAKEHPDVFLNPLSIFSDTKLKNELGDLLFYEDGDYKITFFDKPTKDWDAFVHVGFLE